MSTAAVSVLVAALAVVIGAVMQSFTIRTTRRNAVSELRAGATAARLGALREALAEYMTLTYYMDREQTSIAVGNQEGFSEEYYERAGVEDRLYNKIRLYLDIGNPDHERLIDALEHLRRQSADELWIERRDKLVAAARRVFAADERRALT